ncbi:T9SS type A sorting domain-containing protein [Flammeovirga pacifica]|uniref:Secretion system C-terminal sorting domain-containing protein n=1 Tax=Flammeovirga pacifica TaxID=915059 RepID=A0A1S1Z1Y9_FLAPC|nr:T9SS type A sorting domain-containing protein [Flammeovirga pacifica]OHX67289.1 hypothetical protein NH26_13530 [Flammeovirga pacifica]
MKKFYLFLLIIFNSFEVFCQDIFSGGESSDFGFIEMTDEDDLPVELNFFHVSLNESTVLIEWSTSTEINNDYFEVEKSVDNLSWEVIGTIDGHGNSSTKLDYSYNDDNLNTAVAYYRLKQVDYDGQYEYFGSKKITTDIQSLIHVYPNPARGIINIEMKSVDSFDNFVLFNHSGQKINTSKSASISNDHVTLDLSLLEKGMYYLKVNGLTKKLVVY